MLFEHKSYLDKKVGFQLLKTMVMLWDRLLNPRKKTKGTQQGSEHTDLPPYNETLHVVHLVREANEFDRTKIFDRKNNTNSFRSQDDFRFRCL